LIVELFLSTGLILHYFLLDIPGYIDPNSAMAILTMLMGAIAGIGMTLKLYWSRLKLKLSQKNDD
jgi:hypothetical protein